MTVARLARLCAFGREMAPPRVYLTYAVVCVLGLRGALAMGAAVAWRPLWPMAVAEIVTIWSFLFYIRAVDEQKDLDYDRIHNPGRPLVRGSVTASDLRLGMAFAAALAVGLNAWRSWTLTALVVAELGYVLFLVQAERLSRRIRDGILINLLVTYPVQILMGGYLIVSWYQDTRVPVGWSVVAVSGVFLCAFLHFEIARKTSWSSPPGEKLYSSVVGPRLSGAIAFTLGAAAIAFAIVSSAPSWPHDARVIAALVPLASGAFLLRGARSFARRQAPAWPRAAAMGFLATLYIAILVAGLILLA
jgi:hypothetical protein